MLLPFLFLSIFLTDGETPRLRVVKKLVLGHMYLCCRQASTGHRLKALAFQHHPLMPLFLFLMLEATETIACGLIVG